MEPVQSQDAPQTDSAEAPAPKIKAMRRQPCPCGSGKVFKNCHEGDPGYEVTTDAAQAVAAPVATASKGPKAPMHQGFQQQANKFSGPARNTSTSHRRKV